MRHYFRVDHGPRVRIREPLGTEQFDKRYYELMRQHEAGALKKVPRGAAATGTLRWLGQQYISSTEFKQLDPRTQHVTRLILESMYAEPIAPGASETFGECPLGRFGVRAVGILVDRKAATPEAANNRLKRLRAMFRWAMLPRNLDLGVTANPARDVPKLRANRKGGVPRWKPTDLDQFEACHPIGMKARLALTLLMFTGARRSDVVRLGWPMVRDGVLNWVQHKGRNNQPIEVTIPLLPDLRNIIEATPVVGTTTFLVTQYGRPFTPEGFGNRMAEWCKEAGLPGLNSHGVRKAAADGGASAHRLMAWFGWLDIKQTELYTRDAERKFLARENAHLLGTNRVNKIPHLGTPQHPGEENGAKKRG
jgi:integrase